MDSGTSPMTLKAAAKSLVILKEKVFLVILYMCHPAGIFNLADMTTWVLLGIAANLSPPKPEIAD
jgi:hypothetical protein